jgi:glycosyltransferase involved in cell wall biosynthesis
MRIAIDVSQVVYGTGVSSYTQNLVENLLKIDKDNEYLLFAGALRRKSDVLKLFPQTKVFPIPPTLADLIWNKLHVYPIEKLIGQIDVFHSSDWAEPPSSAFKVTTVHDLGPILYPRLFPKEFVRDIVKVHKKKLSWVKKESNRIIVPSTATKADLVLLGFDENKIRVIPEAPSNIFKPASSESIEKLKSKYKIAGKYVLAVGMNMRKNTENIIRAFDLARSGQDLKLVFVGLPKYLDIKETRNVRIAGLIPFNELPVFYSGAEALVYPSYYEGFGLPILEAFACGTPVVTSNLSSMPEVAGDAAVLVDPGDVNSIADGITKALKGPKGLIDKGNARVREFSWEKTAKMTLDVYNEAKKRTI